MSWLSADSFTSLRSQISELTRDVIQETDADRGSLESDYQLAKARLAELEVTEASQRSEIQHLMLNNLNMQERVEAAELQAATVSKEFRNVIVSLQEELKGVSLENHSLKDYMREQSANRDGNKEGQLVTEREYKKQISELQEELYRYKITTADGKEVNEAMQGDEQTTSLQWERGRGDGVDYENNTLLNIDTMNTGVTQDTVVYRQQTSVDNTANSDNTVDNDCLSCQRLEILLTKERAHKDKLLTHLQEISADHDRELVSLLDNNTAMSEELEELRRKVSNQSTRDADNEKRYASVHTQTLPLSVSSRMEREVIQEETGWLQDEVKNLSIQLRTASLQVEALTRERETKQRVLENLQLTVRQLERENDSLRSESVTSWREQVLTYQRECEGLSRELSQLRTHCEMLERDKSQQLTANDVYTAVTAGGREMRGPHEYLEAELLRIKADLHRSVLEKNEMIKREQTRALLLQYLNSPSSSRNSSLRTLSELLILSKEDIDLVSRITLKESNQVGTEANKSAVKSFSQLFVEFLMQESNPRQSNHVIKEQAITPSADTRYTQRDKDERPSLAVASLGRTPAEISKVLTGPLQTSNSLKPHT